MAALPTPTCPPRNIYQEVTDRIVAALEKGVAPWVRPWNADVGLPRNGVTGRPYSGLNTVLLWLSATEKGYTSPDWFTYRSAAQLGGQVRKGEKGTLVTFWKALILGVEGKEGETAEDKAEMQRIPLLKHFVVFNREQIEGLPNTQTPSPLPLEPLAVEQIASEVGAEVIEKGAQAAYNPKADTIYLPPKSAFTSAEAFASVLLHEVTHWTGHPSRLARSQSLQFGSPEYAREELVAEMGSAFLCAIIGISRESQHAEYLGSWLELLHADNKAIFHAASQARQVVEFLTERSGTLSQVACGSSDVSASMGQAA